MKVGDKVYYREPHYGGGSIVEVKIEVIMSDVKKDRSKEKALIVSASDSVYEKFIFKINERDLVSEEENEQFERLNELMKQKDYIENEIGNLKKELAI